MENYASNSDIKVLPRLETMFKTKSPKVAKRASYSKTSTL